jgi:DNA topoisomerase IA
LWILVKRELEIRNFKPTTYFSLTTTYGEGFKSPPIVLLLRKLQESVEVVDDSGEEKAGSESRPVTDKAA